ncbi:hypothetical protein FA13DRAFT_1713061 [Coprinellus micaceus]|uniref:Uncharacterized protein n=1 Tax=Coprinellus micaceus TaxID=71717 RepID=A0A4Y7SXW0_COPMI|nr:hypothetical protein FA13DRAFT_1713061 [Coprinellus micaceus]
MEGALRRRVGHRQTTKIAKIPKLKGRDWMGLSANRRKYCLVRGHYQTEIDGVDDSFGPLMEGECRTCKLERSSLGMGVIVVFFAATFLTLLDEVKQEAITVLAGLGPTPDHHLPDGTASYAWAVAEHTLSNGLPMIRESLQLFLNYKSKVFSSRSKLIVFVVLQFYTDNDSSLAFQNDDGMWRNLLDILDVVAEITKCPCTGASDPKI